MQPVITINPQVMHGIPCFAGTRVALQTFFDHIAGDYSIDEFLEEFPSVRKQQVMDLIAGLRDRAAEMAVPVTFSETEEADETAAR
jgi:uncharacterized protein (DUF433 family)